MQEIWKDVVGYEGLYQVSNLGRVKRISAENIVIRFDGKVIKRNNIEKMLKLSIEKFTGYKRIVLCKNGLPKKFSVHRLVAIAFIENPNNFPCVNHKDENKLNNCVDNLEWCDHKYNMCYGTQSKRGAKKRTKSVYCVELDETFNSIKEASEKLGIGNYCIGKACSGVAKTAGGYHWQYANEVIL